MRSLPTIPSHGVGDPPLHHGKAQRRVAGVAALAWAVLLGACGGDGNSVTAGRVDGRVSVIASFYPVAEIASRVGGDRVRVTNLTPAGVEPHDRELTSRQVDQLEDAGLVVYLGQGFQPAIEVVSRRNSGSLDVLEAVSLEKGAFNPVEAGEDHAGDESEDEHAEESDLDPHFWLDPTLMAKAVDAVSDALVELDADGADVFGANAQAYKDELAALDAEFEAGLATCDRREMVTSHAAFHYLARRYGLAQLPIAGLSPDAEPDPSRLAELADEIREKGITTVFFEELVSPAVAETLAREVGVATAVLSPLEGLTERDAEAGKDYAAVMRENLAGLRHALGCR